MQKADEDYIKDAFEKTIAVRKFSKEAQELADIYFFETVVHIHRTGEGELIQDLNLLIGNLTLQYLLHIWNCTLKTKKK